MMLAQGALYAAAPDLLDALEAVLPLLDEHDHALLGKAERAIAKARGQ